MPFSYIRRPAQSHAAPVQTWLAAQLADGPRPAAEIIKRAASAEIWERSLYRAAIVLGTIRTTVTTGETLWQLRNSGPEY